MKKCLARLLNILSFDATLANTPLSTAHPELARLNDQTVIDYLARYERNNLAMQVRAKIIEGLPDGRPSQEDIAETLNTSLRSLQRRLRDEDTTFKDLLNETQQELALQYMRDTSRSIGEVTYLLGFSEPSNFTRAFKRWTGKSPGESQLPLAPSAPAESCRRPLAGEPKHPGER